MFSFKLTPKVVFDHFFITTLKQQNLGAAIKLMKITLQKKKAKQTHVYKIFTVRVENCYYYNLCNFFYRKERNIWRFDCRRWQHPMRHRHSGGPQ